MNTRLLTLLHYIQSDYLMSSMLGHEDQVVLTSFIDFLTQQQTQGAQMQESQAQILGLSRSFQQEIAIKSSHGIEITLSRDEYESLPSRQYFHQKFPFPEGQSQIEMNLGPAEFGSLKLSAHPGVRAKHFNIYANSCEVNAEKVLELVNLRRGLALSAQ